MKFLVVFFVVVAVAMAHPDRERRSIWGLPLVGPVAPATAVIGPHAGPTAVIGPNAAPAVVAAGVPAVVAGPAPASTVVAGPSGTIVTNGVHHWGEAVIAPEVWGW